MTTEYSIIIATKNEEEGIAKVLCFIPKEISKQSEVIIVDSSTDCTPIIAERLGARVIHEPKEGKGRAMKRGVGESIGEVLIFLDGDGTDPPQYIPRLLEKLEGATLVLGCRCKEDFEEDDPWMRNVFRFYAIFVGPLFRIVGLQVSDPLAGFRAIRRGDWDKLDLESDDFRIEVEMDVKALKENFTIDEVEIPHLKRAGGMRKSKLATNPTMWFKIMNVALKYTKDEKIKKKIRDFGNKLKTAVSNK